MIYADGPVTSGKLNSLVTVNFTFLARSALEGFLILPSSQNKAGGRVANSQTTRSLQTCLGLELPEVSLK